MSCIIFIDTSVSDSAVVALEIGGKRFEKKLESRMLRSQVVLPLIESLLNEHACQLSDITGIQLAEGPGSYTGLRVGAAIANSLCLLLGVSVNGKQQLAIPKYE